MFTASNFASGVPAPRLPFGDFASFLKSSAGLVERTETSVQTTQRILILEEDGPLVRLLSKGFATELLAVDAAGNEEEALSQLSKRPYGVVILSLDLSNNAALRLLRSVRALCPSAGILVLGRLGNLQGMVSILDQGADDYLAKPFSLLELTARVRALYRRTGTVNQVAPKAPATLVLNRTEYRVERSGRSIDLTPREFALLEFMVENAGKALSRSTLMRAVWNMTEDANTNIVDVYMKYLRDKLDCNEEESLIRTVRGVGYVLNITSVAVMAVGA